jgi:hypothetical protein
MLIYCIIEEWVTDIYKNFLFCRPHFDGGPAGTPCIHKKFPPT